MSAAQKTSLALSLNRFAETKAGDAIQQLGKALPCSVIAVNGSIITVQFEVITGFTLPNITVPHSGAEWIRYPTQVGDKGVVIPAVARLNDTSGIGTGKGDLIAPANLSALVFMPVGNAYWTPPDDANKLELYGKTGVIIKSRDGGTTKIDITDAGVTITSTGTVTINAPNFNVNGDTVFTGNVTANGHRIDDTHKHVNSGGSGLGGVPQ